jgi:DNA-binding LacI/PurR family transcriptional regulator
MAQLGRTAAELLVDRLQNAGKIKAEHCLFPVEIIDRKSVSATARS